MEHIGNLGVFGWQGAFADTSGVGFHDAHDSVHAVRWNTRTGASATGGSAGRSHKGIGAVIEIEERPLGAFEQNVVPTKNGLMQQDDGVGHEGFQVVAGGAVLLKDVLEREWFGAERFEDLIVLANPQFELALETFGINQVDDAQSSTSGFVTIGGTDPALG